MRGSASASCSNKLGGTLRATAEHMHLHHSSVSHRLAELSRHLGFTVDALENRARVTAMIMLVGNE
jgi:sugar diacid utilization regulator